MTDTPGDMAAKSPTIEEMVLTLENAAQCEDAGQRLECLLSGLEPPPGESVNAATLRAAAALLMDTGKREKALREALRETAEELELRMARNGEPTEASSPRADAEAGAAFGVLQRASALVRGK